MKVALITETFLPQVNGIVRTLEKVILHLEANGHEAIIITLGKGDDIYSKTPVVRLDAVPFSLYKELHLVKPTDKIVSKLIKNDLMQLPLAALQTLIPTPHPVVEKTLEDFNPDLIHLVTPATLGAIGSYYVDKLKLPSLATYHTDIAAYAPMYRKPYLEEIVNTVTKLTYDRADRVLAPSPSSVDYLERIGVKGAGIFSRGVGSEIFTPDRKSNKTLEKYGLDPDKLTLVYAGRLAEEKAIPEVIAAFKALAPKHNIQLLLAGDGPIRKKLEKELQGTAHAFSGMLKGDDYADLHAVADIFTFPSKTETFGQVVLEAMSSGSALVVYDAQGVNDLVTHEKTGLLAPVSETTEQNISNLTACIERLIIDNKLREACSAAARAEALTYDWDVILDGLVKEYESLVKQPTSI